MTPAVSFFSLFHYNGYSSLRLESLQKHELLETTAFMMDSSAAQDSTIKQDLRRYKFDSKSPAMYCVFEDSPIATLNAILRDNFNNYADT